MQYWRSLNIFQVLLLSEETLLDISCHLCEFFICQFVQYTCTQTLPCLLCSHNFEIHHLSISEINYEEGKINYRISGHSLSFFSIVDLINYHCRFHININQISQVLTVSISRNKVKQTRCMICTILGSFTCVSLFHYIFCSSLLHMRHSHGIMKMYPERVLNTC